MVDQLLFKIPGVRSMMGKLVGLQVLQAFLIIGQTLSLSAVLVGLWQGNSFHSQLRWVGLFIITFVLRHAENWLINGILDKQKKCGPNYSKRPLNLAQVWCNEKERGTW